MLDMTQKRVRHGRERVPTLVVAVGGYVIAFVSPIIGIILHAVSIGRREAKRLAYLSPTSRRG